MASRQTNSSHLKGLVQGWGAWTGVQLIFFSFSFIYFCLFFKKYLFYLEANYNIVVVFAIHCYESAMGLHVFPILNPPSLLPPHPIPLGHPSAPALSTLSHAWNIAHLFEATLCAVWVSMVVEKFCSSPLLPFGLAGLSLQLACSHCV